MKVHMPAGETRLFPCHEAFDKVFLGYNKEIVHYYGPEFKDYKYQVSATGDFGGDIKSNDCSLVLSWSLVVPNGVLKKGWEQRQYDLARIEINRFTGNCGVKAISHLYWFHCFEKSGEDILKFIESFTYHYNNCGLLIGSDTKNHGFTGEKIKKYGKGYTLTASTWNPNYTWDKKHEVFLFYKDLNLVNHENFWGKHPNARD